MVLSLCVRRGALCLWLAILAPGMVLAQANFATNGGEYAIAGSLIGDQQWPQASINSSGGFLVGQDNAIDGRGLGIFALGLDNNFLAVQPPFRVNQVGAGDQERARVALLTGGGAAFAWQGGRQGFQHIYTRFLSTSNTWFSGDVMANTPTNRFQRDPAMAALAGGNLAVVWASLNQQTPGSMEDIYGQLFSSAGQKIGGEFAVNQFTPYNQRTPDIAALNGGGFVVVWVSEQQRASPVDGDGTDPGSFDNQTPPNLPSVDIYARLYDSTGSPAGDEFIVNDDANICAHPSVAAASDGGFMVAWDERDPRVPANSLDVFSRPFSSAGVGGAVRRVNTYTRGDQYAPRISALGTDYLVAWTSLAQDGSDKGVFGQFLRGDGSPAGTEFRVNTTTIYSQMQPAVASDNSGRFLALWTSFRGGVFSFDLYAQRYASADFVPTAPVTNYVGPASSGNDPSDLSTNVPPGNPGGTNTGSTNIFPKLDFPSSSSSGTTLSNAFALAKGSYNGLFYDSSGVQAASSGYLTAKTTARGAFSAKLWLGQGAYSCSGQFDPATGSADRKIFRSGLSTLNIHLQLDLSGGDQISGHISDGHWTADLLADRLVFSKSSNPAPQAGNYTLVITNAQAVSGPAIAGVGAVKVDAGGVIQLSGTLADGTKLTQSSGLSKHGIWPLYSGKGCILGWIQIPSATGSDIGGQVIWVKPGGVMLKYYPGGAAYEDWGDGSLYTRPSSGSSALNFSNGSLTFSGGGLSQPWIIPIALGLNSKVTAPSDVKLSLSINPSSGLFKGHALSPETGKTIPFQGVVLERANIGVGYFLNNTDCGQVFLGAP
ncbi:MAG: hypothetical protein QOJ40_214 [Verrucomicrobiota bacterium]